MVKYDTHVHIDVFLLKWDTYEGAALITLLTYPFLHCDTDSIRQYRDPYLTIHLWSSSFDPQEA